MIRPNAFVFGFLVSMSTLSIADSDAADSANRAHVRNSFEFVVQAPLKSAIPLFGANAERSWAGKDWDPQFIYPIPAVDVVGAVFTNRHASHQVFWVNTAFDIEGRRVQYVYFIGDLMVTTIDLTFFPLDSARTKVHVVYERTSLSAAADDEVKKLGSLDRERGAEWDKAINASLRRE